MQQLRQLDLFMYVRAVGLLVRNPSIVVVPLLMGVVGVFVGQIGGNNNGSGVGDNLTGGLASLLIMLLKLFAFGVACIIADMAWRHGRASFDEGWIEARRKGGDILTASLGFSFVLYIAQYAGQLLSSLGLIFLALAGFFLLYTIPAAAVGGVPGGAALQISIERARSNPLATIILAVVSYAAFLCVPLLANRLFALTLDTMSLGPSTIVLIELSDAVVQSIVVAYIALIITKTYANLSFGHR